MKLIQKQEQRQQLSPQMIHTFNILQLPILELKEHLEKKLEENPFLEEEIKEDSSTKVKEEKEISQEDLKENNYEYWLDYDLSRPDSAEFDKYLHYRINSLKQQATLESYLLEQLSLTELNKEEKKIGEFIIGNLDENGYLRITLEEIAESLGKKLEEVEKILKIIQSFEPAGVGARNLEECLLIQLRLKNKLNPILETLITEHLSDIAYKKYKKIAKNLSLPLFKLKEYIEEIKKLDPKPARNYNRDNIHPVIPDIILSKSNGKFTITINEEEIPKVKIRKDYFELVQRNSLPLETKQYLRQKYKDAKMLIKAIEQRKNTLARVVNELVSIQADFFEYGYEALKPLRLDDLAKRVGVNESTISRVISNKYIMTPNGIFPLKKLFDYKVYSHKSVVQTCERIKNRIKQIILKENPHKPYSDSQIVKILKEEGINVARRTVAKYRKQLKILPKGLRVKR